MLYTPPVAASEMHNYSKEIRHCVLSACCDDRTKMLETRSYPEFLITRRIQRYRKRPSLTHFATLTSWDFESWIYRDASSINLVSIGMIGKADFLQITIIPIFFSAKGKKKKKNISIIYTFAYQISLVENWYRYLRVRVSFLLSPKEVSSPCPQNEIIIAITLGVKLEK